MPSPRGFGKGPLLISRGDLALNSDAVDRKGYENKLVTEAYITSMSLPYAGLGHIQVPLDTLSIA